jgi:hypothetical protein
MRWACRSANCWRRKCARAETVRVIDAHEIPTLPGHHAGYVLRILGPMELAGKYEWYELTLAPGGELASQATIRARRST